MLKQGPSLKDKLEEDNKLKNAYAIFFEKIALSSGLIISVSITFLGYVISKNSIVLSSAIFSVIPIYYVLFSGWFMLFLSFLFGMYIRLIPVQIATGYANHWYEQDIFLNHEKFLEDNEKSLVEAKKLKTLEIEDSIPQDVIETIKWQQEVFPEVHEKRALKLMWLRFLDDQIKLVTISIFVFGFLLVLIFTGLTLIKLV